MLGEEPSIRLDVIPDCIYTNPEIASVGLTEAQAKEQGMKVKTSKASMLANGKSMISLQDRGFIKLVYDEEGDRLVGAQLMCARATDMVGELATAIVNGLSQKQLAAQLQTNGCDITETMLGHIETGYRSTSIFEIDKLAEALKVDYNALFAQD